MFCPPPKQCTQNLIQRKGKMDRTSSTIAIGCPRRLPLPETSWSGLLKAEMIMHSMQVLAQLLFYNIDINFNKHFQTCLVDHLLACIKGTPYNGNKHQFTDQDCDRIIIDQNQLYEHKTIQLISTTYDTHWMEDHQAPQVKCAGPVAWRWDRWRPSIPILAHKNHRDLPHHGATEDRRRT